jgi:ATP-binding cassette, subfamily B, bacterial
MVNGVYRKLWDHRGHTQHKEAGQADDDDDDDDEEDDDEDDDEE